MRAVTNTKLSDSRIKIRPKIFNLELEAKQPKYTGKGLIFNGNLNVKGSIVSGFSSNSYIDTGINLGNLNTNHTYTFRVKFRQTTFDSYFVNTMGSSNNRINGLWSDGRLELATSRNIYDMQNTKVNVSEFVNKWLIAETIWDRGSNKITYIYYNEDNSEIGRTSGTLNSNFASENLLIGIGLLGYPAYNLEIDLLDTYVLKNNMSLSSWVENIGPRPYTIQRYYHNQIGTADGSYRMFTGFILILGDEIEQHELRPKNDPQLWQRDENFVKTVFTTNTNDWLRGNLSTSNKGAKCVDEYKLQTGEYIVKYNFNGSYDTCWYSRNGYYLQNIFCPTGSTYGTAGGNDWNQERDCSVDIYLYDCPRLYAFAFNNFGGYHETTTYKYSPNTREYYELEGVILMDKTVGRGRAQYKEIVYNL